MKTDLKQLLLFAIKLTISYDLSHQHEKDAHIND